MSTKPPPVPASHPVQTDSGRRSGLIPALLLSLAAATLCVLVYLTPSEARAGVAGVVVGALAVTGGMAWAPRGSRGADSLRSLGWSRGAVEHQDFLAEARRRAAQLGEGWKE